MDSKDLETRRKFYQDIVGDQVSVTESLLLDVEANSKGDPGEVVNQLMGIAMDDPQMKEYWKTERERMRKAREQQQQAARAPPPPSRPSLPLPPPSPEDARHKLDEFERREAERMSTQERKKQEKAEKKRQKQEKKREEERRKREALDRLEEEEFEAARKKEEEDFQRQQEALLRRMEEQEKKQKAEQQRREEELRRLQEEGEAWRKEQQRLEEAALKRKEEEVRQKKADEARWMKEEEEEKKRVEEEKKRQEEEEARRRKQEEIDRRRKEEEVEAARKKKEEEARRAEDAARRKAEETRRKEEETVERRRAEDEARERQRQRDVEDQEARARAERDRAAQRAAAQREIDETKKREELRQKTWSAEEEAQRLLQQMEEQERRSKQRLSSGAIPPSPAPSPAKPPTAVSSPAVPLPSSPSSSASPAKQATPPPSVAPLSSPSLAPSPSSSSPPPRIAPVPRSGAEAPPARPVVKVILDEDYQPGGGKEIPTRELTTEEELAGIGSPQRQEYAVRFSALERRLAAFEASPYASGAQTPELSSPASSGVPPVVCVLTGDNTSLGKVQEVLDFLASKGVRLSEIRVVNASNDYELAAVAQGQRQEVPYPCVLIRDKCIGSIDDLRRCAARIGVLEALLAGQSVDLPSNNGAGARPGTVPQELRLGLYDSALALGELTLKTALLPITAPFRLYSWWSSAPGSADALQAGEDIDVIQSNWYWRHQLRTLRFTADSILRIRPGYNDLRAANKYEDVTELRLVDPTNLVITYKSGTADYLRAPPADVRRICDIVCLKNPAIRRP